VLDTYFGVVRESLGAQDGPDSTAAFLEGMEYCFTRRLPFELTQGTAFVSSKIINRGVSMIGAVDKATSSIIRGLPGMPDGDEYIRFETGAGSGYHDFIRFENFRIEPTTSGTIRGGKAFHVVTSGHTNLGQMAIRRLYLGAGRDTSLKITNDGTANPQGNPSNAVIEECSLFEGADLYKIGDNVSIRDNFIITSQGSGRHGLVVYAVDQAGGVASFTDIRRNAMNADGSAIIIDRGRNVRITDNNIESSHGTGVNATVVLLRGAGGSLSMPIVRGNAIGVFGASNDQVGINVQNTEFAQIRENNIITDRVRSHAIAIGASKSARIYDNKVSPEWTNNLLDGGVGTLGGGFYESSL